LKAEIFHFAKIQINVAENAVTTDAALANPALVKKVRELLTYDRNSIIIKTKNF